MSALREAVLLQMRLRGFAQNTVDAYLHAMERLWEFYKRALEGLSCAEVQRFLDEIITVRKRAWATVNVYFSAYRFLSTSPSIGSLYPIAPQHRSIHPFG